LSLWLNRPVFVSNFLTLNVLFVLAFPISSRPSVFRFRLFLNNFGLSSCRISELLILFLCFNWYFTFLSCFVLFDVFFRLRNLSVSCSFTFRRVRLLRRPRLTFCSLYNLQRVQPVVRSIRGSTFGPGGRLRFWVVRQFRILARRDCNRALFSTFPARTVFGPSCLVGPSFGYGCLAVRPMTLGVRSHDRRCLLLLSCLWFLFSISWSLLGHRLRFKFLPIPICFYSHFPLRRKDEVPLVGRGCVSLFFMLLCGLVATSVCLTAVAFPLLLTSLFSPCAPPYLSVSELALSSLLCLFRCFFPFL
jgi:hypothetical protein